MKLFGLNITRSKQEMPDGETNKYFVGSGSGPFGNTFGSTVAVPLPSSPITDSLHHVINNSGYWYDNPQEKLGIYALLWSVFPHFQKAGEVRQNFIGELYFQSEDKGLLKELELFAEQFQIWTQYRRTYEEKGFEWFLKNNILMNSFKWGKSFNEIRRQNPDDITSPVVGGMTVNSALMKYIMLFPDVYDLIYESRNKGNITINESSPDIITYAHNQSTDGPWGYSLTHDTEYVAYNLIRLISSKVDYESRIGNPREFITVSLDPKFYDSTIVTKDDKERIRDEAQSLVNAHKLGVQTNMKHGKQFSLIQFLQAPIKTEAVYYGQNVQGGTPEQAMKMFTDWLLLKTGVPGAFLGVTDATGLNSDMYKEQRSQLETVAEEDAKSLSRIGKTICENFLMSIKSSPKFMDKFKVCFEAPEMNDEVQEAQAELYSAQALQQQLINFAELSMMDTTAGDMYAEEVMQIPGLKFTEPPAPPVKTNPNA